EKSDENRKGMANLHQECDILIDQLRAIDNRRLIKKIGKLPDSVVNTTRENLRIVLDLD
ncbi:MAG: type II toxin-antitoxin system PemK/MazF family toxin, partial [Bacteroidales bacterium]|nr:type II toxin-antitoxin system PemK/MazF family toxin [Bacteroidales bacterium]